MGGLLIIGSVFISTILWARLDSLYLWLALGATSLFAFIGFADDYIKIVKKRNLGLTGKQKLLGQIFVAVAVWGCLWAFESYPWNVSIPFLKATADPSSFTGISWVGPWIYLGFIVFILLGFFECRKSDRWFGRTCDQRDVYRDVGFDGFDLCRKRQALVGASGFDV